MQKEITNKDVVAIALGAAALGGVLIAIVLGFVLQGWDELTEAPMRVLGSSLLFGFYGMIIALFTAGPLGIAVGLAVKRWIGMSRPAAAAGGAATAFLLYLFAYWEEGVVDPFIVAWGLAFCAIGAGVASLMHGYVTNRARRNEPPLR